MTLIIPIPNENSPLEIRRSIQMIKLGIDANVQQILYTETGVNMQSGAKIDFFTPPKNVVVTHIVVRDPSASLTGGTSYSFGSGSNADSLLTGVTLAGMTTIAKSFKVIPVAYGVLLATDDVLGMKATTGSTAAATATIDIFGYYPN
jgi:hypothetical protein